MNIMNSFLCALKTSSLFIDMSSKTIIEMAISKASGESPG